MEEPKPEFDQSEIEALYANNVQFESSVWDLKLIFGQLDQAKGSRVDQHTAITLAWPSAKVAAYYMLVNLIFEQSQNGDIRLPSRVIPARPDPLAPEVTPEAKATVEYIAWLHDQFFSDNAYIPPAVAAADEAFKNLQSTSGMGGPPATGG